MDLPTVITNLKNTIHGKEVLLQMYQAGKGSGVEAVDDAMVQFLVINLKELNRILADLEEIK